MNKKASESETKPRVFPTPTPPRLDVTTILDAFAWRMLYSVAKDEYTASDYDVFQALAYSVRDRLMERWFKTQDRYYDADAKRIYYLSLEFLMGRALLNNVLNLNAYRQYSQALEQIGYDLEDLEQEESDAGLGNGGLGRLAACFLDSAATLGLPFYGYGIRYEYGIFRQSIENGAQVESPDNWLKFGNPWEIARADLLYPVHFYGKTTSYRDENGVDRMKWVETQDVFAMAFDTPILGYGNNRVNTLRLWSARSSREFDLTLFNTGDYVRAVEDKTYTENISKVLYPPDDQYAGKELRLKQQYFFASATLRDMLRRFLKKRGRKWEELPDKVAIQLNDTHPTVAIPELMRVLVDDYYLDWDFAWNLTTKVFAYTNHTILAEALESWPLEFFGRLLPRHLQIIEEIDRRLRNHIRVQYPGDEAKVNRMSVIDDGQRRIRMANLAIVGSHSVNGVAKLHTEILKRDVFKDFEEFYPGRINNKTNGITPRRWLYKCNPRLTALITESIGHKWVAELDQISAIEPFMEDAAFREQWRDIKRENKVEFAEWAEDRFGFQMNPDSLFDVQIKRMHEYKRQLLNVLHVLALYVRVKDGEIPIVPRTVIMAGKAAPSYAVAKQIIQLVHAVAAIVNEDPQVSPHLKLFFIPNYGVLSAERIFPACELSEQISTAGTEASGTGNMKAALNGALTIGTLDGANVEILEAVGNENIFIFGHTAEEVNALRQAGYNPAAFIEKSAELRRVIELIETGIIAQRHGNIFQSIVGILRTGDRYFHCADFDLYADCHKTAMTTYADSDLWTRKSIANVARMGRFSSDRTVREYATEIWNAQVY